MREFKVNIKEIIKYGGYENTAKEAGELFAKVFNMAEFRTSVLDFSWNGKNEFANNNGLSNEEVFNKLFSGEEIADPSQNFTADFILQAYSKWWPLGSAVGFTDADAGKIYTKWHFIKNAEIKELAAHYAHEYCHCIGFEHDYDNTPERPFSVPYAIGDIVENIIEKM